MRKGRIWKRCLGLAVSLAMMLPSAAVYAREGKPAEQAGAEVEDSSVSAQADENGFVIDENGVLTKYEGTAAEVVIPEGVTGIGDRVFDGCRNISSIELPSTLTEIGLRAFAECGSLKSIILPAEVCSIGTNAFGDCSSLTKIEVEKGNKNYKSYDGCLYTYSGERLECCPAGKKDVKLLENTTIIGTNAFDGCRNLNNIELPSGITEIGEAAFSCCSSLTDIKLPPGITEVGFKAFFGCESLVSIELPPKVTFVRGFVFEGCDSLVSVKLPSGVTAITWGAFMGCSSLSSIELPLTVTEIQMHSFAGCINLRSIKILENVNKIHDSAFRNCKNLTIYGKENSYVQTYAKEHNIPFKSLREWPVKALSKCQVTVSPGEYTYDGQIKTPNIIVKDGSKTLARDVDFTVSYQNNTNAGTASAIVVGKSNYTGTVTKAYTIAPCSINKAKITLSRSSYTYDGKAKKPAVTVTLDKKNLTDKTDYTASYANNTKAGTATVTITGKGNYTGTAKTTFTIQSVSKSRKSISKATVTLKKSSYAYDGKTKKPAVTVTLGNKTLKANRDYTVSYKGNKNIGKANVTVTGKGDYTGKVSKTFKITAKKGTSFTVSGNKYKIVSASQVSFTGIKNAKAAKVVIPSTVKIGGKTFQVTSIAANALKNKTKITSVTVGSNVTAIGGNAFYGCKKLAAVTIKSVKLKTVGKNAFKGIKSTAKIKVPKAKEKAYKKLMKGKGQGSRVKIVKA